uniref:Chromodomain helicase DNA binding protein 8 n=1 Tax=Stegastes partitus TaxID=144197 RepID=A0A3B5BAV0_9TELE
LEQLEKDKRIHQKIKRFKTKHAQMRHLFQEDEEPFNPDYVEVDRILDVSHSVDKDNGEPVIYYLVKWCSLPYEDATWELKEDVDEGKVEEFSKIQNRQPRLKRTTRPPASSWKKLEETREYKNGNTLREYQLEGVNWLLFNWYNRQNCILADEMGLGKTIQSIALLSEVYAANVQGPFLVIAPLSTITNWEREFSTWTHMNAIVYHGSLASRQMIQQYEMYCKDDKEHLIPGAYKFDALITTFEMVLSDCPELREISCWGRWRDILSHARCKRRLSERDVETICRVILVFCLLHYRGDENIKSFIWELITPPENGREPQTLLNHSGLSIPVPRGRKGKRVKAQSTFDVQKVEWIRKYNPDTLLLDDSYRKHLKHQCNKVLLRVRMLYYLKQEVIGEHADSVLKGADIRDVDIWMPEMEQQEVPAGWWDAEADRSLLAGVFKHGYEMYTTMRADPCLCFLERAGRPDDKAIDAEQGGTSDHNRKHT